ncbi:At2g23090 like protein [Mycena floridula]|nr:At2g23090 like protein [Mycena floridula]
MTKRDFSDQAIEQSCGDYSVMVVQNEKGCDQKILIRLLTTTSPTFSRPNTNDGQRCMSSFFYLLLHRSNLGQAKAQQKRERNADKSGAKGSKSQAKVNEAAKSIVCNNCKKPFLVTTREPELVKHATDKHSQTLAECFPTFVSK